MNTRAARPRKEGEQLEQDRVSVYYLFERWPIRNQTTDNKQETKGKVL